MSERYPVAVIYEVSQCRAINAELLAIARRMASPERKDGGTFPSSTILLVAATEDEEGK